MFKQAALRISTFSIEEECPLVPSPPMSTGSTHATAVFSQADSTEALQCISIINFGPSKTSARRAKALRNYIAHGSMICLASSGVGITDSANSCWCFWRLLAMVVVIVVVVGVVQQCRCSWSVVDGWWVTADADDENDLDDVLQTSSVFLPSAQRLIRRWSVTALACNQQKFNVHNVY